MHAAILKILTRLLEKYKKVYIISRVQAIHFQYFSLNFVRLETSTDKTLADSEKSLSRLTEFLASDHEFDEVRLEVQKNLNYVRKETDGAVRSQQTEQVKQQLTVCLPEMYIHILIK